VGVTGTEATANLFKTFCKAIPKLTMLLSLRLGFTQNLTDHILNVADLPPLLLRQKPLVQARVNALLEKRRAPNTNNTPRKKLSRNRLMTRNKVKHKTRYSINSD
jgi:hypothetical protein